MSLAPDTATEAILCLIDHLDAEGNTVVHAVVRLQATVCRVLADLNPLLAQPPDLRATTEAAVRLLQHRAALVAELSMLTRDPDASPEVDRYRSGTCVAAMPLPPRPQHDPAGCSSEPAPALAHCAVSVPRPPRLRRQ